MALSREKQALLPENVIQTYSIHEIFFKVFENFQNLQLTNRLTKQDIGNPSISRIQKKSLDGVIDRERSCQ